MLKILGVSRSGYRSFLNRKVSPTRQQKNAVKKEIQKIYDNSKQNYGAPKIAQELRKSGKTISQRTVGKYMREMGIRAQWTKPWTTTTKDSDFSKELHNILNEQFNPERSNAVWCTDITYIWTQDGFVYLNCYRLVCQKNHCMDSCRHYGSIYSYRNNQQGKSLS